MKKWYESKAFWFNVLAGIVMIASAFGFAEFEPAPEVATIAGVVIVVINLLLRLFFTEPLYRRLAGKSRRWRTRKRRFCGQLARQRLADASVAVQPQSWRLVPQRQPPKSAALPTAAVADQAVGRRGPVLWIEPATPNVSPSPVNDLGGGHRQPTRQHDGQPGR